MRSGWPVMSRLSEQLCRCDLRMWIISDQWWRWIKKSASFLTELIQHVYAKCMSLTLFSSTATSIFSSADLQFDSRSLRHAQQIFSMTLCSSLALSDTLSSCWSRCLSFSTGAITTEVTQTQKNSSFHGDLQSSILPADRKILSLFNTKSNKCVCVQCSKLTRH